MTISTVTTGFQSTGTKNDVITNTNGIRRKRKNGPYAKIRSHFLGGSWLCSAEAARDYGAASGLMTKMVRSMSIQGHVFETKREPNPVNGRIGTFYRIADRPSPNGEIKPTKPTKPAKKSLPNLPASLPALGSMVQVTALILRPDASLGIMLQDQEGHTWGCDLTAQVTPERQT